MLEKFEEVWAKRSLILAVVAVVPIMMMFAGCSVPPAEGKLQVLYSGNMRGNVSPCGCKISKGGVARLATFFQRNQDPSANWLTVDAGNFVDRSGAKGGCSKKCEFMLTSYEGLNYDVLNIARQEVGMGYETLVTLRDTSKSVEFVSANLLDAKTNKPLFKPYVIKDYGNMRVGVLGLLREADFPPTTSIIDTNVMRVGNTREYAARYLKELQGKANAIVLLCELSTDDLDTLLKEHPYIDLVVSTGALRSGETTVMIGATRVVGTGSSGYNGHWAKLEFNPSWGDSIGYTDYKDALTDAYELPGEWTDKLAAFEEVNGLDKKTKNTTAAVKAATENPNRLQATPVNTIPANLSSTDKKG